MTHSAMSKTHLLIILDGFGYSEDAQYNAIAKAKTPHWDALWNQYPHTLIQGSGQYVGLPEGQMGNSEVGHLNIGAGRLVDQDISRIDSAIEDSSFFSNPILTHAMQTNEGKSLHIMGLLSPGGVHSHQRHIHAAINMAHNKGLKNIYFHAFLDGRDTPPKSAEDTIDDLETLFQTMGSGKIVSIIGRHYAMDRDQRWDRVEKAYNLLIGAKTEHHANSAAEGLASAYARGETDEFVQATSIHPSTDQPVTINDGDSIVFMNFRADRARQLTQAFTDPSFEGFPRNTPPKLQHFVCLTEYADNLKADVAYPPISLDNVLGEYLANLGLKQLHTAETEKYAHVTFFFNGGREAPFANEDRKLIPSPNVATYDLQPEMHAKELTEIITDAIDDGQYDVVIANFANPDMVGHTGNFDATVKAIETIDTCLGKIYQSLQKNGGEMFITADHGNADLMFDQTTKQPHTAHTCSPVPLLYVGQPGEFIAAEGTLSDIAPTLLHTMGYAPPPEMTGKILFKIKL